MGVFSTREKADDAYVCMMREELALYLEANDDDEGDCEGYETMEFAELEDLWCEKLECESLFIVERELDAPLVCIHSAGE